MAAFAPALACLPWYDLPRVQPAHDRFWSVLAGHLRQRGLRGVPPHLTRHRPLPWLIGAPDLMIGQCCGYDLIYGFGDRVRLLATPVFDAPGCVGPCHRSFVLIREDFRADRLEDLRGRICVLNSYNSHSGANALRGLVAPLSENGRFFSSVRVSGSHVNSLAAVQSGEADVMCMDCVTHALLARHTPEALTGTRILCETETAPAPPFVTASTTDRETVTLLQDALLAALSDTSGSEARDAMLLKGAQILPLERYSRILEIERAALGHGYYELHATSAARSFEGRP